MCKSNGRKQKEITMIWAIKLRGNVSDAIATCIRYSPDTDKIQQDIDSLGWTIEDLYFIVKNNLLSRTYPNETHTSSYYYKSIVENVYRRIKQKEETNHGINLLPITK